MQKQNKAEQDYINKKSDKQDKTNIYMLLWLILQFPLCVHHLVEIQ